MPLRELGPDTPIHEIKADLFKALGHPARVRVLELLARGEQPVSQLLTSTGMESSHLSQHLSVLRRANVVAARRAGNSVHYRLTDPSVEELLSAARAFLLTRLSHTRDALGDLELGSTQQ